MKRLTIEIYEDTEEGFERALKYLGTPEALFLINKCETFGCCGFAPIQWKKESGTLRKRSEQRGEATIEWSEFAPDTAKDRRA